MLAIIVLLMKEFFKKRHLSIISINFVDMKCQINVYMLNEHFSQEHADANHNGLPSENNRKYDWEDDLRITTSVIKVEELRNVAFPLQGEMPNGKPFNFEVKNMFLFEVQSVDSPTTYIGCSESILSDFSQSTEGETIFLSIYLKDYEAYANPIPGIYIASKEFPKELIF